MSTQEFRALIVRDDQALKDRRIIERLYTPSGIPRGWLEHAQRYWTPSGMPRPR